MIILKPKRLFEVVQAAGKREYNLLLFQMKKNPALEKTLTTPIEYQPKYQNLTDDDILKRATPLQIIMGTMSRSDLESYFIKNSRGFYVGFFAIILTKEEGKTVVNGIKVFSFGLEPKNDENQIFKDLPKFLDQCLAKYHKVSWTALEGNKANRAYAIYTKRHKGSIVKLGNKVRYICNENFLRHTITESEMQDIYTDFP
jgi:hypothetical protein